MRALRIFAAAFVLATIAFWVTMLTDPPASKATNHGQLDIRETTIEANPSAGERYEAF